MDRRHQLLAVQISTTVNKIAWARLVYVDGAAARGDFPLSNADTFIPGKEVEILAGPTGDPVSVFQGLVVRQAIKVREQASPQLIVECRHRAMKLTVGRKNAYFLDQTDSDIISALAQTAGLQADVESTTATHPQQVQYNATDWDFLLLRASANGKLVFCRDAGLTVQAPALGTPVATLQFGATILDLDAEIDARRQFSAIKSFSWDAAQQSVVEKEAADPGFSGPGNLASDSLAAVAGLDHLHLHNASLSEAEAQAWADATWLHSRLGKVVGRLKCEGIATVKPEDTVTLAGCGARYNGDVFVTGVRHDCDTVQGWKTHIQFGQLETFPESDAAVSAPQAGALLPGVNGLQIGVVVSNEDPESEHRVQVRLPLISPEADGAWARVASLDAGEERGFFFRPEIGDEVVVGFLNDDPRQAVILGMLHSSAKAAPLSGSDDNHEKVYQSRAKMKIYFNDDTKVMQLETPAGNKLTLSEADEAVTLADQNGNTIEMTADGITLTSSKALTLKAGTELQLESGTSLGIKGGSELKLEGAASAEISSPAATKVKGGVVQIN